jgi:hypothetical protein
VVGRVGIFQRMTRLVSGLSEWRADQSRRLVPSAIDGIEIPVGGSAILVGSVLDLGRQGLINRLAIEVNKLLSI